STYTSSNQVAPAVAMDTVGEFVVTWQSVGSYGMDCSTFPFVCTDVDTSGYSIQAQRFDAGGHKVNGQFQVNSYTTLKQQFSSVAMDGEGNFVVAWQSNGSYGTDSYLYSVQAQRYRADGAPIGGEFQVNTYTSNDQYHPSVATDADGNFVVAWQSYGSA